MSKKQNKNLAHYTLIVVALILILLTPFLVYFLSLPLGVLLCSPSEIKGYTFCEPNLPTSAILLIVVPLITASILLFISVSGKNK